MPRAKPVIFFILPILTFQNINQIVKTGSVPISCKCIQFIYFDNLKNQRKKKRKILRKGHFRKQKFVLATNYTKTDK